MASSGSGNGLVCRVQLGAIMGEAGDLAEALVALLVLRPLVLRDPPSEPSQLPLSPLDFLV